MKHTLKQIVQHNTANLTHVCEGKAYYEIFVGDAPDFSIYQLEINSNDPEWKATYLYPEFKAITLMRWIRKGIDKNDNTLIQIK